MTLSTDNDPGVSLFVGNIDEKVNEVLLRELFIQVGPVSKVHMPVDNLTKKPKGFAFVDFSHSVSGEYAIHLLNDTPMFGKPMTVRHSHRGGGSTTGPATPSLYQAAQQQLDRLQQQAHAQANAASSVKSPSLIGKPSTQVSPYSQGIPYYSPREDNAGGSASTSLLRHHSYPAEARSSQQSSYFSRGPDTQAPLRRSSSGYGYSDSTPPDRTYTRHHSDSQRNYPTDRQDYSADRSGYNSDSRDYQADRREHGDGQRRDQYQSYSHTRSDMPAPRSNYRGDQAPARDSGGGVYASHPSRGNDGYSFTPDRQAPASRYHPYSRSAGPPSGHPASDPNQRFYSRR